MGAVCDGGRTSGGRCGATAFSGTGRVRPAQGESLAAIKAARIIRDYDGRYGAEKGPASADAFLEAAYRSLSDAEAKPSSR